MSFGSSTPKVWTLRHIVLPTTVSRAAPLGTIAIVVCYYRVKLTKLVVEHSDSKAFPPRVSTYQYDDPGYNTPGTVVVPL